MSEAIWRPLPTPDLAGARRSAAASPLRRPMAGARGARLCRSRRRRQPHQSWLGRRLRWFHDVAAGERRPPWLETARSHVGAATRRRRRIERRSFRLSAAGDREVGERVKAVLRAEGLDPAGLDGPSPYAMPLMRSCRGRRLRRSAHRELSGADRRLVRQRQCLDRQDSRSNCRAGPRRLRAALLAASLRSRDLDRLRAEGGRHDRLYRRRSVAG